MNALQKLDVLKSKLQELESVAIAFSGGVDSTFLLKVAHDVLGEKCVAVTIVAFYAARCVCGAMATSFVRLACVTLSSSVVLVGGYYFTLGKSEKIQIAEFFRQKLNWGRA